MHSKRSPITNWRLPGTLSVCSMTTRSSERGRPMGLPCTPVQKIGQKRMQCDRRVSRNSTFVTSSPATDTRVWARDAVKGMGGREAGQNKRYPYPLKR